jgi:hypothetical protein
MCVLSIRIRSMDMLSLAPIVFSLHPLSLPRLSFAFPLPTVLSLFQVTVFVTLPSTVLANSRCRDPAHTSHHILLPSINVIYPYQHVKVHPVCDRTHNCYCRCAESAPSYSLRFSHGATRDESSILVVFPAQPTASCSHVRDIPSTDCRTLRRSSFSPVNILRLLCTSR